LEFPNESFLLLKYLLNPPALFFVSSLSLWKRLRTRFLAFNASSPLLPSLFFLPSLRITSLEKRERPHPPSTCSASFSPYKTLSKMAGSAHLLEISGASPPPFPLSEALDCEKASRMHPSSFPSFSLSALADFSGTALPLLSGWSNR